jgi:hypothetical protein
VVDFAVAAHLHRLAFDPADGDVLDEVADAAEQHLVAGKTEDLADAGMLAEHHGLDAPVMAVVAHGDAQLPAVEGNMHRLAADRWKARQNRITIGHGGRTLRCRVVTPAQHRNHASSE